MQSLPLFHDINGRPVLLAGEGPAADAKARLLTRAGGRIVRTPEDGVRLAVVAVAGEEADHLAALYKGAGLLVNVVDRPELCDFTFPAIVDREPVIVAIGSGGRSAGLAKAVRQRLELLLPSSLGRLADALFEARPAIRAKADDPAERRLLIDAWLEANGALDPFVEHDEGAVADVVSGAAVQEAGALNIIRLHSADTEDLTLREARWLASADMLFHRSDVPAVILDRARADAQRVICNAPPEKAPSGRWVDIGWAD